MKTVLLPCLDEGQAGGKHDGGIARGFGQDGQHPMRRDRASAHNPRAGMAG
ncbi:MAG: hypothetical protein JXR75_09255 [Rhodobacteraceae bacterium]|nr:hypothetical protein [Paracoccaceae bacterium]